MITVIFLLNEEGKFIENVSVLLNEWKGRPKVVEAAISISDMYFFGQGNFTFIWEKSGNVKSGCHDL